MSPKRPRSSGAHAARGPARGSVRDAGPSGGDASTKHAAGRPSSVAERSSIQLASGCDWVAGFHAIEAVIERSPERLRRLFCDAGRSDHRVQALIDAARQSGVGIERVAREVLDAMLMAVDTDGRTGGRGSPGVRHQGVVAEVVVPQVREEAGLAEVLQSARLVLVLDGVTDPHNLGACLRSAAAAGVDAVVQPRDHSAPLNAIARRVAAGAAERVPLFAVTNLARTLEQTRAAGFWTVGLDGGASVSLFALDWPDRVVLVVGDEGRGLRARTRSLCDHEVAIPMAGGMESLNVSVATGVALFEWRRRHLRRVGEQV